jgi:PAS domain S-box-containing protein
MQPSPRTLILPYGGAIAAVGTAAVARWLLDPVLGDHHPYATFLLAVLFTAWCYGFGPSLLALLLGALSGSYLFAEPRASLAVAVQEHQIALILYVGVGLACAGFSEALQAARRRAEAAAVEATRHREWLRILLASVGDAVLATDTRGYVAFLNPAAEGLTGWALDEAIGREVTDLLDLRDEDTDSPVEDPVQRVLREGTEDEPGGPRRLVARDGSPRLVEVSATALRDERRQLLGVVLVLRDVTAKRQAEQALRRRADELAELDRRKDEFLAVLSHELRNPLATIRNALHVLQQPGLSAAAAAQAREMMHRQVEQLVRLVDDLLDVSRILHDRIALRQEAVDLEALLARAAETVRPVLDARGHELTVTPPPEQVRVQGDVIRLTQVIGNLLHNAARYTEPGGRVWLSAGRHGDEAVVRIRDTGIGIQPEMLARIFDPFVQSERAVDRAQGGLGIGLTLVRKLVELHGGRVRAHSDGPGTGSEFEVRLPALPSGDGEAAENGRPAGRFAPRRHVLIVDDNVDAAESLALLLRLHGQDVRVTHDGPSALQAAAEDRPDVVLLDIGMPGMDGYEVCRRLRQQPHLDGVRVVALTGWGQDEDRHRSREAGFDLHLVKPVEPHELQQVIAEQKPG